MQCSKQDVLHPVVLSCKCYDQKVFVVIRGMERSGDAQSGDTSSAGLRNIFSDEGLSAFCMPMEAHVLRQGDALVTPTSHQAEQRLKRESNEDYSFHLESEELTGLAYMTSSMLSHAEPAMYLSQCLKFPNSALPLPLRLQKHADCVTLQTRR